MEWNKIAWSKRGGSVSQPGRPASGTTDATQGGSERIKNCKSTCVNPCGAAESKRKAVESHGCFPLVSPWKDAVHTGVVNTSWNNWVKAGLTSHFQSVTDRTCRQTSKSTNCRHKLHSMRSRAAWFHIAHIAERIAVSNAHMTRILLQWKTKSPITT